MIPRLPFTLAVLFLLAGVSGDPQNNGNIDDLIKEVFGDNPGSDPPSPNPNPNPTNPIVEPGPMPGNGNTNQRDIRNEEPEVNGDCTCVPYYLCSNNSVIIDDGTGLLDIRAKAGPCSDYMDVCCKAPLDPDKPIKPAPTMRSGCGKRRPDGVGFRITGDKDHEAQFGEFPWMTALLKRTTLDDGTELMVYQCGGALIHEKVVLTAAHCVTPDTDGAQLVARVGEWDTQTTNEIYRHQNVKVARVIVHPDFQRGNLHNDFALLILENPVNLGENVDTVCLPNSGFVPLSRECYATGWGKDKFDDDEDTTNKPRNRHSGWHRNRRPRHLLPLLTNVRERVHTILKGVHERTVGSVWRRHNNGTKYNDIKNSRGIAKKGETGQYQVILKKIDLPIVTKNECIDLLRKTRLGPFFKLHDSFVCAGGIVGKDTCKGDGGSPLVCPIESKPGHYEVTGLVAWGIGCGDETPGVYAGVAYARTWIDQEVSKQGIQIE